MAQETVVETPIVEAFKIIDKALGDFACRELVSSGEAGDTLLDIRSLLSSYVVGAENVPVKL